MVMSIWRAIYMATMQSRSLCDDAITLLVRQVPVAVDIPY